MTKAEFLARLKPLHGVYEREGSAHTVRLPRGMRITGGDCHDAYYHVAEPFEKRSLAWVYQELLGQLGAGVEPCTDPSCEDCGRSESFCSRTKIVRNKA